MIHSRRDEWCPDWTGAHSVDTDTLALHNLVAETSSEGYDSSLSGGVIKKIWAANVCVYGGIVDDSTSPRHMWNGVLGEEEVGMNVGVKGVEPLFPKDISFGELWLYTRLLTRTGRRFGEPYSDRRRC